MNWEAIGAIGEVAGAIGVIATLIYLAVQIRQNTMSIIGATLDAISERKKYELRWSSDIATAFRKSLMDPDTLTENESWQVTEWMTACFVARQNEYFQFKHGLIDAESWAASEKIIRMVLGSDWHRNWWQQFAPNAFTESFVTLVETVIEKEEVDYRSVIENRLPL